MLHARGEPIFDEHGRPRRIIGSLQDVTERTRADAELRRHSGLLATLLATTADGSWRVDKQGRLLHVNEAYARMSGYTSRGAARAWASAISMSARPPNRPSGISKRSSVIGFDRFETRHRGKDGSIFDVEVSASYCAEAGQLLTFVRDITERKLEDRRREQELRTLSWVGRIREALDNDRLVLHAQPIIDLHTREIVSHELLIRMIAADGSIIAPGEFLPAAERFGLIDEIDRWVIRQAAQIAARGFPVNFNLSGASLGQRDLIRTIERLLADAGANPALLTCEITETALATDQAPAEAFVHQLAALGCRIALDDFGTGYGGFTYLKRLPVDYVKIDVAFVRDLADSAESQHVVAAIVNLAKGFNKHTIAEGVEEPETLDLLADYNVDYAQGFAIGRPHPIADSSTAEPAGPLVAGDCYVGRDPPGAWTAANTKRRSAVGPFAGGTETPTALAPDAPIARPERAVDDPQPDATDRDYDEGLLGSGEAPALRGITDWRWFPPADPTALYDESHLAHSGSLADAAGMRVPTPKQGALVPGGHMAGCPGWRPGPGMDHQAGLAGIGASPGMGGAV